MTEYQPLLAKRFWFWATLTYFSSDALCWMKQLFISKTTLSRIDVLLLMSISRLYSGIKVLFEQSSAHKNFFPSACRCWDARLSLLEVDGNFKLDGTIGFRDAQLEFKFILSKVFWLYEALHDAAAAVRSYSGKGTDYCYTNRIELNSCLLGHVTVLLFCFCVKLLRCFSNCADFWSSMSCIELDIDLTDKKTTMDLVFFWWECERIPF